MHPAVGCITRAVKRKAFARAFRGVAAVDEGRLRQELTGNGGKD
jgi:hypothetical protein